MTLRTAQPCGCKQDTAMGQKRDVLCEHRNVFRKPESVEKVRKQMQRGEQKRKPRKALKRTEPKRDWTDGRAKVEEEGCCRICKRSDCPLEAAHVLGREHDEPKIGADGWPLKELYVDPDRIVPACGPFPAGCHGDIDMRRINLLHYLTLSEQLQAVKDAGGIEAARIRLAPVEHREEVERESVAVGCPQTSKAGAV